MLSAKIATPVHTSNDGHSDAEWMELLSIMDEYTHNPPPISAEYLLQVLAWWAIEDAELIAGYHRLMQSRNLRCIAPCRACVERGDQILGFPLDSRNLPPKEQEHPSSPPSSHRAVQGSIRSMSPEQSDLSQSTLAYSDKPPSSFAPLPSPRIVQGGMAPSMNASSRRVQVAGTARAPHEQRRVAINHSAGPSTARPWPAAQGPSNRQHVLQPRGVTGNPYPQFPPLFSTYTTAVESASAGGRGLGDAGHQWQGFRTS